MAGCGAIGSITSAYLCRDGADVTAVDGWFRQVQAVRGAGLTVAGPDETFTVQLPILHLDELAGIDPFDIAILAVKSYDTELMTRLVLPRLVPSGFLVSAQNGLNEDVIAGIVGPDRTLGCVVHMNGGLFEAGRVTRYSSPRWATFAVGELDGRDSDRAEMIAGLLSAVGSSEVSANIRGELWAKLCVNTMTNALAAISGLTTPRLWADPEAARLVARLAAETAAVAAAAGVTMEPVRPTGAPSALDPALLSQVSAGDPDAISKACAVLAIAAAARAGGRENQASMLQDVLKGRRTEIDHLNGRVVSEGRRLGIPTPANAAIVAMAREVESGLHAPGADGWRCVLEVA